MRKSMIVIFIVMVFVSGCNTPNSLLYQDYSKKLECVASFGINKTLVINSKEDYQNNFKIKSEACGVFYKIPFIDFNRKTLVGMHLSGGGCSLTTTPSVQLVNNSIVVNANAVFKGPCKMKLGKTIFLVIDKISPDQKIVFLWGEDLN